MERTKGEQTTQDVLSLVMTGDIPRLQTKLTGGKDDELLLTPILPLLTRLEETRRTARHSTRFDQHKGELGSILVDYEQVNTLREYATVFQTLSFADIEQYIHQQLRDQQQAQLDGTNVLPAYRRFENGTVRDRARLVLSEIYTHTYQQQHVQHHQQQQQQLSSLVRGNELFANEIYEDELAVILNYTLTSAILQENTNKPKDPQVQQAATFFSRPAIVRLCLNIPLGVNLLKSLVLNDPSSIDEVITTIIEVVAHLPLPIAHTESENGAFTLSTSLPMTYLYAQDACLVLAQLAPTHIQAKLSESGYMESLWIMAILVRVTTSISALREEAALFFYELMKKEARRGNGTPTPSMLTTYLRLGLEESGDQVKIKTPFQLASIQSLNDFRRQLLAELEASNTTSYKLTCVLNVYIGLIVLGNFHPSEQETMQLLRWFDKISKNQGYAPPSSRVVTLAYALVILLCYPLAPSLNKIPSQRDESTKLITTLSQQCIFSLYNTKAACPLFIISAVLFYTKSSSLVPFLSSVIGNDGLPIVQSLRAEYLHVFGDVVLKPILTESIMAREVLTFPVVPEVNVLDHNLLHEMTLRGMYGLLSEKSFLRHHHGRQLEAWLANQMEQVTLPMHPLMMNVVMEWIENYIMAFEYPIAQTPFLQLSIIPLRSSIVTKWLSVPALTGEYIPAASSEHRHIWARAALVLTYALQLNQRIRYAMMVGGTKISAISPESCQPTGDIILSYELTYLPLRNILQQVMKHRGIGGDFEYVASSLQRLMIEEYPHLVDGIRPLTSECVTHKAIQESWFRRREQILLELSGNGLAGKSEDKARAKVITLVNRSWLAVNLFVMELEMAPAYILIREFEVLVDSLLPFVIISPSLQPQSSNASDEGESDVTEVGSAEFCVQVANLYETRVRQEHTQPDRLQMKLVHALCVPDLVLKHQQQYQKHGKRGSGKSQASSDLQLITYTHVLEEPFRLLKDAHSSVYRTPSLLRLLLHLVQDFHEAAIVHITKCDPSLNPRKQPQQGTEASSTPSSLSGKTAQIQQHLLVQECLIVHGLLDLLRQTTSKGGFDQDVIAAECHGIICGMINELLQNETGFTSLHQLIMTIHLQGYDEALVSVLLANVPAMELLWKYWMQHHQSTSSGSTGRSSSSSSSKNILTDFLIMDISEKDLTKWRFRLRLFFSLCGKYFQPSQSNSVLHVMKLIWKKLRNVVQLSTSSSGGNSNAAEDGRQAQITAFLEEVLPLAVGACAQHAELSAEFVQFLLKMQKQGGGSGAPSANYSSSFATPSVLKKSDIHNRRRDLDDVLHHAYQLLLQEL